MADGAIITVNDERQSCWCCLGTGDDERGSECIACDGSGVKPDSPPCRPLCREPERPPIKVRLERDDPA